MTVAPNPEIEAIGPGERRPGLEQRWKNFRQEIRNKKHGKEYLDRNH
jgi:hypothetical protein